VDGIEASYLAATTEHMQDGETASMTGETCHSTTKRSSKVSMAGLDSTTAFYRSFPFSAFNPFHGARLAWRIEYAAE
jgi:hypothetical protein